MSDLTVRLPDERLHELFVGAVDREERIPDALAALGPVADRDLVLLHPDGGLRAGQLGARGARVAGADDLDAVATASVDVVVACWSAIRPGEEPAAAEVGGAMRVLRPGGRLLVVHDYARDDVTRLLGDGVRERTLVGWSRRDGPFLANGFKVRVLHCWWSWDSVEAAAAFLRGAFGEAGERVAETMRRPRLAYKIAVYHRGREAMRAA